MTPQEEMVLRTLSLLTPPEALLLVTAVKDGVCGPLLEWNVQDGVFMLEAGAYSARVWRQMVETRIEWPWEVCKGQWRRASAPNGGQRQAERALFGFLLEDLASLEEAAKRQSSLTSGLRVAR